MRRQSLCYLAAALLAGCGSSGSGGKNAASGGSAGSGTGGTSGIGGSAASGGTGSGGLPGTGGSSGSTSTGGTGGSPATGSVIQHHNNPSRDGLYVASGLTAAAAAKMHIDTSFTAKMQGPTYAQPLYVTNGPQGKAAFIVATEQNVVYAFDANGGAVLWKTPALGTPVPKGDLPCGDINPLGITGTPYIDLGSRNIYLDAMTTPDNGTTKKHLIFALSLDDGSVRSGWPVDVSAKAVSGSITFDSAHQNQRGALALVGGILYVPYGGHDGDCNPYHGWVVGVQANKPSVVKAWATPALRGGIWGPSGVSSDGTSPYATTGNTTGTTTWGGGEAVIRFDPGPVFSGKTTDYFAPSSWHTMDVNDQDLGGSAALLVNVPGATPSQLAVALGKDGNGYLLNRGNLGGIGGQVAEAHVASGAIIGAAVAYPAGGKTFVSFRVNNGGHGSGCTSGGNGNLATFQITAAKPPAIKMAWCSNQTALASPVVTTTDGQANPIVWAVSGSRLYGFDGNTGQEVFGGGGSGDVMSSIQYFQTPIVAGGRIVVAAQNQLYAFKTP